MQINNFLIANLQIQWLKQARKDLMQQNKLLFMILAGSGEFVLIILVFLLAQILAGHYSPLKSHALLTVIGLLNIAVIQLTMHLLNSDFDQLWLRLPKQKRWLNAARTSVFTLLPMLIFILPSGFYVFFASDFETQRVLTIFQWLSIVLACFGLHCISIYQQRFRISYALISIMVILSSLNFLWWLAALFVLLFVLFFSLFSHRISFKYSSSVSNSWWVNYTKDQHKRILLHVALILIAAALPLINSDFKLILSIISASLLFWFSHNHYQRFIDFIALYPLNYLPNADKRIQTLKRKYGAFLSLLIVGVLGFYSIYDLSGVFVVLTVPIMLGTALLCLRFIQSWISFGSVYVSALALGMTL